MTQGKDPRGFVDNEFLLAVAEDMYVPGFTEAYMLARKALLHGACMLSDDGKAAEGAGTEAEELATAVRSLRGSVDEKTWLEIVSYAMGKMLGNGGDGKLPVPYGWRWASDLVRLEAESVRDAAGKKAEEDREEERKRRERIEEDSLAGRLRNLEEARKNIENDAVSAADDDFGIVNRTGSHGIVIVTNGEVRTQIYTEPLLEKSASELEEAVKKVLCETGEATVAAVLNLLSEETQAQITRVVEDNAAFHGYDPSAAGNIGTHIFMAKYFERLVGIIAGRFTGAADAAPSCETGSRSRIVNFRRQDG